MIFAVVLAVSPVSDVYAYYWTALLLPLDHKWHSFVISSLWAHHIADNNEGGSAPYFAPLLFTGVLL